MIFSSQKYDIIILVILAFAAILFASNECFDLSDLYGIWDMDHVIMLYKTPEITEGQKQKYQKPLFIGKNTKRQDGGLIDNVSWKSECHDSYGTNTSLAGRGVLALDSPATFVRAYNNRSVARFSYELSLKPYLSFFYSHYFVLYTKRREISGVDVPKLYGIWKVESIYQVFGTYGKEYDLSRDDIELMPDYFKGLNTTCTDFVYYPTQTVNPYYRDAYFGAKLYELLDLDSMYTFEEISIISETDGLVNVYINIGDTLLVDTFDGWMIFYKRRIPPLMKQGAQP